MDDPLLPWWSILLLGLCAVALTVWMHPTIHREVRLWAGLSTLVYLALIFVAMGGNPLAGSTGASPALNNQAMGLVATTCGAVSIAACVWMLGPIRNRCRQMCYVIFTISNATICGITGQSEIAIGLVVVAAFSSRLLVMELVMRTPPSLRECLTEFITFTHETSSDEPPASADEAVMKNVLAPEVVTSMASQRDPRTIFSDDGPFPDRERRKNQDEFWLIGGLFLMSALALIGTVSYSLRVDTSRTTASLRHTSLPSHRELDQILARGNTSRRDINLTRMALGVRADIVVLLVVIIFLRMAMSRVGDHRDTESGEVNP